MLTEMNPYIQELPEDLHELVAGGKYGGKGTSEGHGTRGVGSRDRSGPVGRDRTNPGADDFTDRAATHRNSACAVPGAKDWSYSETGGWNSQLTAGVATSNKNDSMSKSVSGKCGRD